MRIPKNWVPGLSSHIIDNLLNKGLAESLVDVKVLKEETEKLLMDELMVEDRLNEEVRNLLKQYGNEIEKGRLDFRKLFDMTKQRLVKERNIIL